VFEDHDEDLEFWSRVPDSRFDAFAARRQQSKAAKSQRSQQRAAAKPGSRSHLDTQTVPVTTDDTVVTGTDRQIDPLLRRAGALAVAIALLVPVALTLRSGDDGATTVPASTAAIDTTTLASLASTSTVLAAAAPTAVADAAAAPAVVDNTIDIDALPEAIPVRTDAPAQAEVAAATVPIAAAPTAVVQAKTQVEAAPSKRPNCAKKYTVQAGDAWISIATRAGVTTKQLLAANNATTKTPIYPGRDICLPDNATTPTTKTPPAAATPATKSAAPAPKATTTTTPATIPVRNYSKAEVAQIIRDVWPDDLEEEAIRIATRESNLVPTAKNYCCHGLFQIYFNVHKKWLAQMGVTNGNQLFDPRTNALAALVLWQRSGSWAPWRL
jgi:LysM repeat protein